MRTTVAIDDDVLVAAKNIANSTGASLGSVLSGLARQSLSAKNRDRLQTRNGVSLLPASPGIIGATLDDVNRLRDDTP